MESPQEDQIHLKNVSDRDTFNHAILLLKGNISNVKKQKSLQIFLNHKLQHSNRTDCYNPITQTLHFKCIVELERNNNELVICYVDETSENEINLTNNTCESSSHNFVEDFAKTELRCDKIQSNHGFFKNQYPKQSSSSTRILTACQENTSELGTWTIKKNLANNYLKTISLEEENFDNRTTCNTCIDRDEQSSALSNFKWRGLNKNKTHFNFETEDVFHSNEEISRGNNNIHLNDVNLNKIAQLSTALDNMDLVEPSLISSYDSKCLHTKIQPYNVNGQKCASQNTMCLILYFIPRETQLVVTPVYIVPNNHHGRFQTLEGCDNTIESACSRIVLGVKLIQCLMSMLLTEHKTFQLEHEVAHYKDSLSSENSHYINNCLVFHSSLSVEQVDSYSQEQLWEFFGRELMMSKWGSANKKFVAFLSCTQCVEGRVRSHAAIGGGGLALFGTGCLHTWPSHVNEIVHCFRDPTLVNADFLMDDSCNRGTYGGCFSTTLGAVCHEMGHTFDLGHSRTGIMGRGFDSIDGMFLVRPRSPTDSSLITSENCSNLSNWSATRKSELPSGHFSSPLRECKTKNLNNTRINGNIFVDFMPSRLSTRDKLRPMKNSLNGSTFGCDRTQSAERYNKPKDEYGLETESYDREKNHRDVEIKHHSLERNHSQNHSLETNHFEQNSLQRNNSQHHSLGTNHFKQNSLQRNNSQCSSLERNHSSERNQFRENNEEEVFWSENCAVMLNYHRWLNSCAEQKMNYSQVSDLKFDARRNTVTSSAGLRLVELRGHKALCLRYWSFPDSCGTQLGNCSGTQLRKCFIIPVQHLRSARTLVAMDSTGHIVKIELL